MIHKPRVLFLLKWRAAPYDTDPFNYTDTGGKPLESGLSNSAHMACEMLKRLGVVSQLEHVIDGDFIHAAAVAFKATHVIIEAFWVTPDKFTELQGVLPHVTFIVRNHSETPFLANEGIAFQWALEYLRRGITVAPNSPRMTRELRYLAAQVISPENEGEATALNQLIPYLPNHYLIREEPCRFLDEEKDVVDVGCFGAVRPMKNQVIQAIAAMRFAANVGKPLAFHINGSRLEGGGEPVLKSLRAIFAQTVHTLVEHPWLDHQQFLTLMLSMDIISQVSFSETYNIVAADAVSEGVPAVTSREVPWASDMLCADPTDSVDIANKMTRAWGMKKTSPDFNPGLDGLRAYNSKTRAIWRQHFLPDVQNKPTGW